MDLHGDKFLSVLFDQEMVSYEFFNRFGRKSYSEVLKCEFYNDISTQFFMILEEKSCVKVVAVLRIYNAWAICSLMQLGRSPTRQTHWKFGTAPHLSNNYMYWQTIRKMSLYTIYGIQFIPGFSHHKLLKKTLIFYAKDTLMHWNCWTNDTISFFDSTFWNNGPKSFSNDMLL